MVESEESSIERLKRTLYSRDENVVPKEKRTPVQAHEQDVKTDWGTSPAFNVVPELMVKRNNSFFNKFLVGSLVFFLLSLGVAVFIFFGGINMISSNNLDINIVAPSSISSGEELDIGLSVVNANRSDLEEAALFIDYPTGAQSVGDGKPLTHDKIDLGTIAKGATSDYTARAEIFGEKDAIKTFIFRIEYKVKGSNAVFSKQKTYDVTIGSSPILLDVAFPKETNSGQTVTLTINVTSNSSVVLKNSLIKVEYPYGFTYTSSNIKPVRDNSVWNIGDLKDGDKKVLTVTGVLVGQNLEDRSFRVTAGTQTSSAPVDFDTTLVQALATMGIRKSFFDLEVSPDLDGVLSLGQTVPISIKWQNTLPDKILNSHIEATVSGEVLDRGAITVNSGGFYRSVDNTILWDKTTTNILSSVSPGDSGRVLFSVGSILNQGKIIKNPHVDVHVVMSGDRSGLDSGPVSSTEDYTIKISSNVIITAKTQRDSGPFSNTGPIPPKADKETTYTINWTLTNTSNDLKDTVVTAVLPFGVEWKNQISPSGEKISFDPDSKVVSWNVGNVSTGVGFTNSPREVSFQVGITPSLNQVGTAPTLVGQANVSATDLYTSNTVKNDASPVNTRYSDPSFSSGKESVVK